MRQYVYFETDGLQVVTKLLKSQPGMGTVKSKVTLILSSRTHFRFQLECMYGLLRISCSEVKFLLEKTERPIHRRGLLRRLFTFPV